MLKEDLKYIWDYVKNILCSRILPVVVLSVVLFSILLFRLFNLQIVHGEEYKVNYSQKLEKTLVLKSTRGNIYDRNGVPLTYNKLVYSVTIGDAGKNVKSEQLNQIIIDMYNILDENNDNYNIDYAIKVNNRGKYEFTKSGNALLRFLRDVYGHQYISDLTDEERTSTAEDVVNMLMAPKRYNISDKYSKEEIIKIIYIRTNMAAYSYQRYLTFTVADNVSEKTMASILENSDKLLGVAIEDQYKRYYNYSTYIAHLIGYTGRISAEELEELRLIDSSYSQNDVVGKSGVEKSYETVLSGTKGSRTVYVDSLGRVKQVVEEVEPVTGSDIYLTIDVELTQKIYELLERRLAEILVSRIVNSSSNKIVNAEGEVVVIPIKDVYFALFNNNSLSVAKLKENHSTEAAASIYEKYSTKYEQTTENLKKELLEDKTKFASLSTEYQEYIKNIRNILLNGAVLNKDMIKSTDELSIQWNEGNISFTDYLYKAIANNWVNIYNLDVNDNYPGMDEVLTAMLDYAFDELENNTEYSKLIMKNLIDSGKVTGREVCMLLLEQEVFAYNEEEYESLKKGASTYDYLIDKIKKLEITPAMLALDPCSGAVVVEDATSGEILAMVTYPSYDVNKFSGSIDSSYYASLLNDKSTPLVNRATQTRIAPGSTFKIATAITGLMAGVITPNEKIECTGIFERVNPNLKCWKYPDKHGKLDVKQAIGFSCNYYFCEVGYRLCMEEDGSLNSEKGLSILKYYAEQMGLATKTGIQIAESTPNASDTSPIASTIGQGTHAYTALNLARYTSTIGNGGTVYNSSVIKKIVDVNGDVIELISPVVANKVELNDTVWNAVYEGGRNVVRNSAVGIQLFDEYLPILIGGKSGTAEENKNRGSHANYISWAPYNNAEISVAVMIPNGYAAVNAGIMSFYALSSYYNSYIPSEIYANVEGAITIIE